MDLLRGGGRDTDVVGAGGGGDQGRTQGGKANCLAHCRDLLGGPSTHSSQLSS